MVTITTMGAILLVVTGVCAVVSLGMVVFIGGDDENSAMGRFIGWLFGVAGAVAFIGSGVI